MSLRTIGRSAALVFLVGVLGTESLQAGPWWWEKHFDGDGYSPMHYWLPGVYRCRAYFHPVPFQPLADAPPKQPAAAEQDKKPEAPSKDEVLPFPGAQTPMK